MTDSIIRDDAVPEPVEMCFPLDEYGDYPLSECTTLDTGEVVYSELNATRCDHCNHSCYETITMAMDSGAEDIQEVCRDCSENTVPCNNCSLRASTDNLSEVETYNSYGEQTGSRLVCGRCADKIRNENERLREHRENMQRFSKIREELSASPRNQEIGSIIKHDLTFGIELECVFPNSTSLSTLMENNGHWSAVSDGSINGSYGREFVSPILQGNAGEKSVIAMCEGLRLSKAKVNQSCGFHLHLGAEQLKNDFKKLKILISLYYVYDKLFFRYLPKARADNSYCQPLRLKYPDIMKKDSRSELDKYIYRTDSERSVESSKSSKYDSARYGSINIHSIYFRGTLEVRSHSGTIEARKVLEWANLHGLILENILNGTITESWVKKLSKSRYTAEEINNLEHELFEKIELSEKSREYFNSRRNKFVGQNQDATDL